MKRLAAFLLVALSTSIVSAATPTLRARPPRVPESIVYTFDPYAGWEGGGFVDFVSSPAFFGAPLVARLEFQVDVGSIVSHVLFTPSHARAYAVSAWIEGDGATEPQPLIFFIDGPPPSGGYGGVEASVTFLPSQVGPGWQRVDLGIFINTDFATPDDPDPTRFVFGAATQAIVGPREYGSWFVGQIEFREVEAAVAGDLPLGSD